MISPQQLKELKDTILKIALRSSGQITAPKQLYIATGERPLLVYQNFDELKHILIENAFGKEESTNEDNSENSDNSTDSSQGSSVSDFQALIWGTPDQVESLNLKLRMPHFAENPENFIPFEVVTAIKESTNFAGDDWNGEAKGDNVFEITYNGKTYQCSGDFNNLPRAGVDMTDEQASKRDIPDKRFSTDYNIVKKHPILKNSLLGYALQKNGNTTIYEHSGVPGFFQGYSNEDVLKSYQIYSIVSYLKEMLG